MPATGVYLTLGNHDYWANAAVINTAYKQERLPVLVNQGVPLSHGSSAVFLGGLDDGWSGHPNLGQTLEGARPGDVVVLLCHEPDLADLYYKDGRIALKLSGHTHAGQIRLPGIGALVHPYLGKKYEMGLYRVGEMWLYTNRGIGCISPCPDSLRHHSAFIPGYLCIGPHHFYEKSTVCSTLKGMF